MIAGMLGSSLIGAIGSGVASGQQASADEQAAQLQYQMFQQMEGNLQPFISQGGPAMNNLMALLGMGGGAGGGTGSSASSPYGSLSYSLPKGFNIPAGDALAIGSGGHVGYIDPKTGKITDLPGMAQFGAAGAGGAGGGAGGKNGIMQALANTPGYQFTKQQGLNALTNQRSAVGGVGGGNANEALMSFGSGLADQTYEQAVGNAFNLAALSENAAAGAGTMAQGFGSNIAQSLMGAGTAQASGTMGIANAFGGGINNFLLAQMLQGMGGGGATGPDAGALAVPF